MRAVAVLGFLSLLVLAAYALPAESASLPRGCGAMVPLSPPGHEAAPPPLPEACSGIRPGARLGNGCTVNWVFENTTAGDRDLYIGTAGHCAGVGQRVTIGGVSEAGTVVFSILGGGKDFAMIRIDEDKEPLVDAQLCHWGGPVKGFRDGTQVEKLDRTYVTFGQGGSWRAHPALQARTGAVLPLDGSVTFAGPVAPGDSGSPIMLSNGLAWGIVTHGLSVGGSPGLYGSGTPVGYAMVETEAALGLEFKLVTAPLA